MNHLKGTGIAIVTPFKADGTIDYHALENLINYWIVGGIEYLVVMGTTGESVTLEKSEKKELFDFCAAKIAGRVPLVIGMGGNNTNEICDSFSSYDLSKAGAILSVSPYYNKPNQRGIYEHFKTLSQNSPLPIILYNVPGRTGSNMTADTTLKLARDFENIVAVKEASGNMEQVSEIIRDKPSGFLVISGDDNLTLPIIASGGDGLISVAANAFPKQYSDMVRLCLNGQFSEARKIHYAFFEFVKLLFADGSPGGIKVALNQLGLCEMNVRMPLFGVNDAVKEAIINQVEKLK